MGHITPQTQKKTITGKNKLHKRRNVFSIIAGNSLELLSSEKNVAAHVRVRTLIIRVSYTYLWGSSHRRRSGKKPPFPARGSHMTGLSICQTRVKYSLERRSPPVRGEPPKPPGASCPAAKLILEP